MKQHIQSLGTDASAELAIARSIPLVVSLEGALLPVQLGHERLANLLAERGLRAALSSAFGTRAPEPSTLDVATLPCRPEVLDFIGIVKSAGRPVYLLGTDHPEEARAIAAHLDLFDGVIADGSSLEDGGYDFIGSDAADIGLWKGARQAYGVNLDQRSETRLKRSGVEALAFSRRHPDIAARIRLLRPHQYAKNALVLVPLLTSHQFSAENLILSLLAALAFCFAASAVYVLNDVIDLKADRAHPTKKDRPLAAGTVGLAEGLAMIPLLLAGSGLMAFFLPPLFIGLLSGYLALTTAYSLVLKRMMLVDVTILSLLYTLRVVAGAAAITVPVSEWLFAFALLMFTALALIKRYVELSTRLDRDLPDPANRDYKISDLPIIAALAAAAGMNAITVLALYVNSDAVLRLYGRPEVLWLLCPLFLYWVSRTLLLAHRRQLHDDPILFALKDRASWIVGGLALAIVGAAL
nr:UbiA family prenyltransferase [uncultured Gellertiella sp.]